MGVGTQSMPIGSLKHDFERDPPKLCLAIGASNMRDPVLINFLRHFDQKVISRS